MKFDEMYIKLISEADGGDTEKVEPEKDPQKELEEKILKKVIEVSKEISVDLNKLINKKIDLFIQKIDNVGVDQTILDYVKQVVIPNTDDPDKKLFISMNIDDIVENLINVFSDRISSNLESGSKQNKEKK